MYIMHFQMTLIVGYQNVPGLSLLTPPIPQPAIHAIDENSQLIVYIAATKDHA